MRNKILSLLALSLLSAQALAAEGLQDYGFEIGFRSQSFSSDTVGVSTTSTTGYQGGVVGAFSLFDSVVLRSGLFYTQRPLKFSVAGGDATLNLNYFDVPLTFGYKFSEYAMVYLGPILSVKLSDDYNTSGVLAGTSKPTEIKGTIYPLVVGTSFRFAPQVGADAFFEMTTGEAALGFKDLRAVGVNLVIYLD